MSKKGALNALEFMHAMSADRLRRSQSLPLNVHPGKLKKVYVRRKDHHQQCKVCGAGSFSKFGRGDQGLFCLRLICDMCGASSYLVLDDRLCETCENRVDCLSEEIENVTTEIICLLI
jgi:hypothetical protein